jgi:hypothetical protein
MKSDEEENARYMGFLFEQRDHALKQDGEF